MPQIRLTAFFKDTNGAGWSETYYNTATDLTAGKALLATFVPKRVALLGSNSGLFYVRVSDDLVKRDSQVVLVPDGDNYPARSSVSNFASDDVVVRCEGNATPIPFTVRRTLALRGSPTNITGAAGKFVGEARWNNYFKAFKTELLLNGYAIRYRTRTNLPVPISAIVQVLPSGTVTVTTGVAHGLVIGDGVKITGVLGANGVQGLWRVLTATDATHFTINIQKILPAYVGGGTAAKNDYSLAVMSNLEIIRCATHKAGRPFDSLVGRRRVARAF